MVYGILDSHEIASLYFSAPIWSSIWNSIGVSRMVSMIYT
jgi:hypothetical protein